jgi:PhnB protein
VLVLFVPLVYGSQRPCGLPHFAHGGATGRPLGIEQGTRKALFSRAIAAGATVAPGGLGGLLDQFRGDRSGSIVDPAGDIRSIATRKADLTPAEMQQRQDGFMKTFKAPAKA